MASTRRIILFVDVNNNVIVCVCEDLLLEFNWQGE
jgi:hypothetical protein